MSGIIHRCNESHIWLEDAVPSCISVARDCSILLWWATWVTMDAFVHLLLTLAFSFWRRFRITFGSVTSVGGITELISNATSQYC